MNLPKRKRTRLKDYDYSLPGAYFITICIEDRSHLLSHISAEKLQENNLYRAENRLTKFGIIAKEQIEKLSERYPHVSIDKYVIMPNHIHMIVSLNGSECAENERESVYDVICAFKSVTALMCRHAGFKGKQLFQSSFHDHIIRGDGDYSTIWQYIDENVLLWRKDVLFTDDTQPTAKENYNDR